MKYRVLSKEEKYAEFSRKYMVGRPQQLFCLHKSKGKPYIIAISDDGYCNNVCKEKCKWARRYR